MLDAICRVAQRGFFSRPLLVVGAGRSGTSVLLRALGQHPAIFSAGGESPFVAHVGTSLHEFECNQHGGYRIDSLKISQERLHGLYRRLCIESVLGQGWRRLLIGLARREFSPFRTKYWCIKTFPSRDGFEGLLRLYPSLKAVYIVRNGIDNVHSRTRYAGFRDRPFLEHCRTWARHVEQYRFLREGYPQVVTVQHKELVMQPEQVFRRIFALCGLSNDPRCAEFVRTNMVHPLDRKTKKEVEVQRVFERRESPHEEWTSDQRSTFKQICGAAMQELRYEVPF